MGYLDFYLNVNWQGLGKFCFLLVDNIKCFKSTYNMVSNILKGKIFIN